MRTTGDGALPCNSQGGCASSRLDHGFQIPSGEAALAADWISKFFSKGVVVSVLPIFSETSTKSDAFFHNSYNNVHYCWAILG